MKIKAILILITTVFVNLLHAQQKQQPLPLALPGQDTIPFLEMPNLERPYANAKPVNRNDNIQLGELGVDGGDRPMLYKLVNEIAFDKKGMFTSFLIAQNGKLLFESYYRKGRIDLPHPQASATKIYTSLAVGRAIQLGYLSIDDLHKPILSFFKNINTLKFAKGVEKITLHKLLSMRSGIRIDDKIREEWNKTPSMIKGIKELQLHFENTSEITKETQTFKYSGDPNIVMHVLEAITPNGAKAFIKKELLDKLNISNYTWETGPSGLPEAGWRVRFTSRDMLKWGLLFRNKGKWNNEQLISEKYVNLATSRMLYVNDDDINWDGTDVFNQGYGYYFWSADVKVGNRSYFYTSAQGGGGQFIVYVKELDLVIVITAFDNEVQYPQIIAEQILPAFIDLKSNLN